MLAAQTRSALESLGVRRGRMLVATSGGLDSMVLLDVLVECSGVLELELVVGHVDHGLRGEASRADAAWVEARARALGLDAVGCAVDPERERLGRSSRDRPTLEEAARIARRRALERLAGAQGCRWIATAHHANDQAETVLLRLLRGTGPEGLAAMAPLSGDGRWVRPLLGVERARLERRARERGLDWREDASNLDRRFARNRLRLDWLPELAATFNPRLLRSLCDLAEAQRRDLEWIEALVEAAATERIEVGPSDIRIAIGGWDALPEALARRLARRVLLEAGLGRSLSRVHLERTLEFLRRGRSVGSDKTLELPEGRSLRREGDRFVLAAAARGDGFGASGNATVLTRV